MSDTQQGFASGALRVLVTGANGFVGSNIVEQCLRAGMIVSTTGRKDADGELLPGYFKADVTKPDSLAEAMSKVDCVIHSAGMAHQFKKAKDDTQFFKNNTLGTENVALSAARAGIRHFVLISSVNVYGARSAESRGEAEICNPQGAYAQSKYQAEQRAMEIIGQTGACLTILRLAVVYGEGDRGNVLRLMRAIDRRLFVWIGRGANLKSMIHCEDVGRACATVLLSPCEGINVYNVAAPAHTMREIVEGIAAALGRPVPGLYVPPRMALAAATILKTLAFGNPKIAGLKPTIEKWLDDDVYSARKLEERLGFKAQVNLKEALEREASWYRQSVR